MLLSEKYKVKSLPHHLPMFYKLGGGGGFTLEKKFQNVESYLFFLLESLHWNSFIQITNLRKEEGRRKKHNKLLGSLRGLFSEVPEVQ